ncbi:Phosphatidylinositol-glycan biosynthesis class X protein, partial [Eschrichtius robustus]|nr:Phosphatidylinositol-glycan biosynthesis class X protein [Eschrichtius robustus]
MHSGTHVPQLERSLRAAMKSLCAITKDPTCHSEDPAVMVSENFNLEAPNYLSKESEVLIYARQDSQCIDCFQAFLPVHYRYHRPHSKDGETFIVLNNPDLLMYCDQEFPILKCWAQSEVTAPCALNSKDNCQWNNMKYKSVS